MSRAELHVKSTSIIKKLFIVKVTMNENSFIESSITNFSIMINEIIAIDFIVKIKNNT
jgi:hypothetical protein